LAARGLHSPSSTDSESGDRVHDGLAYYYTYRDLPGFSIAACVERLESEREKVIFHWFRSEADTIIEKIRAESQTVEIRAEVPLTVYSDWLTGTMDLGVLADDTMHVFDWKTGAGEVDQAATNLQLAGYCAMAQKQFGCSRSVGYLFAAGNPEGQRITAVAYDTHAISEVYETLGTLVWDAEKPDAPRCPSRKACQYCPAYHNAARCPESLDTSYFSTQALVVPETTVLAPTEQQLDQYARIMEACNLAALAERKLKAYLLAVATAHGEEALLGRFRLAPGKTRRNITDPDEAYTRTVGAGLCSHADFMGCLDVSASQLQAACKDALREQGVNVKDQKAHFAELLTGVVEEKQDRPSVKLAGETTGTPEVIDTDATETATVSE
jgi:hypothetical protein